MIFVVGVDSKHNNNTLFHQKFMSNPDYVMLNPEQALEHELSQLFLKLNDRSMPALINFLESEQAFKYLTEVDIIEVGNYHPIDIFTPDPEHDGYDKQERFFDGGTANKETANVLRAAKKYGREIVLLKLQEALTFLEDMKTRQDEKLKKNRPKA